MAPLSQPPTDDASWVPAPDHPREVERLSELQALDLIRLADEDLKQFTRLAANILDVPIAHVGLPKDDTNWLKARIGIDAVSCQRATSFCGHALHEPDMLVVPDALQDARFAGNPFVHGAPYVRFYAGAVIRGRNGEPLGTLCVVDHEPRDFGAREHAHLGHIRDEVQEKVLAHADRKERHTQIVREGMTDQLTGLPSARVFRDRLDNAVKRAHADDDSFGLFIVDIVRFRDIRRANGQDAADGLLCAVADRLAAHVPSDCTVARWAEDAFVIFSSMSKNLVDLEQLGRSVLDAFATPVDVGGKRFPVRLRIGAARYPADGAETDALIDAAGEAVEQVYRNGRNGFSTPCASANREIAERLDLERRLAQAVQEDRLTVFYQPKVCLRQERIIDGEALARWHEPDLGWISPGRFIPIAEHAGLIDGLGTYVLRTACREATQWQGTAGRAAKLAVNVSTQQLQNPAFPNTVRSALEDAGLPPECLVLEVTESDLIEDTPTVIANMQTITEMGVDFAVDDFGTGHASFDYLRRLPVSSLKIDKRFIDRITEQDTDARICNAMIALGHALGLTVVAEGVETREQALFLKAYGCDQLQGFHFSKPLPAVDFRAFVDERGGAMRIVGG